MKHFISSIALSALAFSGIYSQCTVRATAPTDTITCGDAIVLNVFGKGQGPVVFSENFNSGTPTGWAFTQQATFTNPCSPGGVDGTTHIWMGNNSAVPRSLETNPYNFSTATAGATICFDLLFAAQGGSSPCEGPDEPQEGIYLQYKIGNGQWVTIHYFDPNGGNDAQLTNWNNWCFALPQAALTGNVSIRWFQDSDSGADYDHWGIDNVQIYFNDPTFTITMTNAQGQSVHSFPQGSAGGDLPAVAPRTTTDYVFSMQNTNGTICYDTVTVIVRQPVIDVFAGRDTSLCAGQCVTLGSKARVIKSPAGMRTFRNKQPEAISSTGGSSTNVNINIQGLNMSDVQPNSITRVCIDELRYSGSNLNISNPNPNSLFNDAGDLDLFLQCPDGTRIKLVQAGTTSPATTPFGFPPFFSFNIPDSIGFQNTCFVPGGVPIVTDSGTRHSRPAGYSPNENFNGLSGCTANGLWSVVVVTPQGLVASGSGTLFGWSITFDDPELAYTGNFNWSPTTDMTNSTSETPTICPTAARPYVLTVSDTANCVTKSDTVNITINPSFSLSASVTEPSCGASNGSITVTPSPSGNYTYLWDNNSTNQTRSNLGSGSYSVTVSAGVGCSKDTTINLNNSGTLNLQVSNPTPPTCAGNNGSVNVTISGGTAPYVVTVTSGGNTQTINLPIPVSNQAVPNLAAGTYTIEVTDAQQCKQTQTVTLNAPTPPTVSSVTSTPETCLGDNDGTATVNASGGTGTLSYIWSNTQTTQTITSLAPGNFTVTVTDANSCTAVGNVTVNAGPVCCTINLSASATQPACGQSDGSITITVTPNGTYNYAWSAGGSTTNTNSNIAAGAYTVTVTDANNNSCTKDTTITLSNPGAPTIDNLSVTPESCTGGDGTATVTATGSNLSITWSTGATTFTVNQLIAGSYPFTVTDGAGCISVGTAVVGVATGCCNLTASASSNAASCLGNDGTVQVTITTPGTTPYQYSLDGTSYQQSPSFTGLTPGTYSVYISDAGSCADTTTVTVAGTINNVVLNLTPVDPGCTGTNNGSVTANVTGATGNISYAWSNAGSASAITGLAPGTYSVTVTDAANCTQTSSVTLTDAQVPTLDLGANRSFCTGLNANLAAPSGFASYLWSTGETSESITVDSSDIYSLTVSNVSGCTATDAVTVTVFESPDISLPNDTTLYENNPMKLTVSGTSTGGTYVWQPTDGLTCSDCANPVANPDDTTTYSLLYTDNNGCVDSATININVIKGAKVYMPNVFSPNGDNSNDILYPLGIGVKSITWKVFNRWGEIVFQSTDMNIGWDGTYKGIPQPAGIFVYIMQVSFRNNTSQSYNGSLTLIR